MNIKYNTEWSKPKAVWGKRQPQIEQSKSRRGMWKVVVYEIPGQCSKRFILFHEFYTWSFQTSGFHLTWNVFVAAPIPSWKYVWHIFNHAITWWIQHQSCRVFIVFLDQKTCYFIGFSTPLMSQCCAMQQDPEFVGGYLCRVGLRPPCWWTPDLPQGDDGHGMVVSLKHELHAQTHVFILCCTR